MESVYDLYCRLIVTVPRGTHNVVTLAFLTTGCDSNCNTDH